MPIKYIISGPALGPKPFFNMDWSINTGSILWRQHIKHARLLFLLHLTLKEEEMGTDSDPDQIGRLKPIPKKVPEYACRRITLADGIRSRVYLDELGYYFLFGNEVTLHKQHVDTLNSLIDAKKILVPCYVSSMNKTFLTSGQRMYFFTHFTQEYLKGHMYEGHSDLSIKAGNGRANVIARLIMGVDKRATITRNWAQFFDMTNMRGVSYAFAFEELTGELHLTVHSL